MIEPATPPPTPDPPEVPWPPVWARTVAFFFGLALMAWEVVLDELAHMWVFGPAYVLTGLPLARNVEKLLDWLSTLRGPR